MLKGLERLDFIEGRGKGEEGRGKRIAWLFALIELMAVFRVTVNRGPGVSCFVCHAM